MLYVPPTAPAAAVAVKTVESEVLAVWAPNADGESIAPRADWNVERAPLSDPTAEICVVTACVWLAMTESCGARVAATSCETRELTLMTDPPAAAALLLPAIETTGALVLLTVVIVHRLRLKSILSVKAAGRAPSGARPLGSHLTQTSTHQVTAASAAASECSAGSCWPEPPWPCRPAAESGTWTAAKSPAHSPCPRSDCVRSAGWSNRS